MTRLKRIREQSGMTQKRLSEVSGVNLRMIQYYEQGAKNINTAEALTVLRIADALHCEVREILEM